MAINSDVTASRSHWNKRPGFSEPVMSQGPVAARLQDRKVWVSIQKASITPWTRAPAQRPRFSLVRQHSMPSHRPLVTLRDLLCRCILCFLLLLQNNSARTELKPSQVFILHDAPLSWESWMSFLVRQELGFHIGGSHCFCVECLPVARGKKKYTQPRHKEAEVHFPRTAAGSLPVWNYLTPLDCSSPAEYQLPCSCTLHPPPNKPKLQSEFNEINSQMKEESI